MGRREGGRKGGREGGREEWTYTPTFLQQVPIGLGDVVAGEAHEGLDDINAHHPPTRLHHATHRCGEIAGTTAHVHHLVEEGGREGGREGGSGTISSYCYKSAGITDCSGL